ncbi:hypothetical protein Kpol_1061p50 [Vanderwaltozyma polyspora DSM 70294]|uniref:2-hydroxyacyl-CoA lyase n=1 Tax=Vanderwaltozyma polyspora (strain ATCC 22028 / DSM 70294 / BCRC 21397 / CBS 2163 / NBRC 10782 / NRRL Y-8283 / UCD 57-17) TaxID=436907 RepID=A7TJH4_VANPO|nr:uncharacterized protein Kpol_1061p50 [Vanderwaltozyma polyspora DSM 70294]EDO17624.1 hypothetical protein Kpol_1061p50 [Vanderwaltozyma polyspora DSM 70294]
MQDKVKATQHITDILLKYDIDTIFGIVGIPVVELADSFIANNIRFISFRNEQSASYAASVYGYLNNKPGILLTVGGPGLIHSLAGIYNSIENKWPLIVLTGSIESTDQYKHGFQELDHVSLLHRHINFTAKLSLENIDRCFYEAMRNSCLINKGVSFIEIPGDLFHSTISTDVIDKSIVHQPISKKLIEYQPTDELITKVSKFLLENINKNKKNCLVVIGDGAMDDSQKLTKFLTHFNLPFITTPMARGIVPDSSKLNVASARSLALKNAEIVLLIGTKLNWILHFGSSSKWNENTLFIQIDNSPSNLGLNNSKGLEYSLFGNISVTLDKLSRSLIKFNKNKQWRYQGPTENIKIKIKENEINLKKKESNHSTSQLNYNEVYGSLRKILNDRETIIVMEGANTMDIARISFKTDYPQHRLDCGNLATMGVGLGYAISAKLSRPDKTVVLIQGDSAFGFSGMEIETAVRNKLGLIIIVMNNSGIYKGVPIEERKSDKALPSTALTQDCRYDIVGKGLGANGYLIRDLNQLDKFFKLAVQRSKVNKETSILNVILEPGKQKKLSFGWQTKARL